MLLVMLCLVHFRFCFSFSLGPISLEEFPIIHITWKFRVSFYIICNVHDLAQTTSNSKNAKLVQ